MNNSKQTSDDVIMGGVNPGLQMPIVGPFFYLEDW